MSENDQVSARTVGQLRAQLAAMPDHLPVMIAGDGVLDLVQRGEAGAGEARAPSGFVDKPEEDATVVNVVWLLGERRPE